MKDTWSVEELAQELDVTSRTIRNYLKSGALQGTKVGGQWRFTREHIYDFIGSYHNYESSLRSPSLEFLQSTDNAAPSAPGSLLVIDLDYSHPDELELLKNQIIEEFNTVYQGGKRTFDYRVMDNAFVRITLTGSLNFVINFGSYIRKLDYERRQARQQAD